MKVCTVVHSQPINTTQRQKNKFINNNKQRQAIYMYIVAPTRQQCFANVTMTTCVYVYMYNECSYMYIMLAVVVMTYTHVQCPQYKILISLSIGMAMDTSVDLADYQDMPDLKFQCTF